jgi:hypothetical protein
VQDRAQRLAQAGPGLVRELVVLAVVADRLGARDDPADDVALTKAAEESTLNASGIGRKK